MCGLQQQVSDSEAEEPAAGARPVDVGAVEEESDNEQEVSELHTVAMSRCSICRDGACFCWFEGLSSGNHV